MKKFLEELINISSISNNELNLAKFLNEKLQRWGFQTLLHKVASTSANLFAWVHPEPPILLSTHLDTVPPFIPAHSDGDTIYGRGACDAKGIITSMIETVLNLESEYRNRVGLLFVAREETDSAGARQAVANGLKARYIINGEPTENKLASAQKGSFKFRLIARGKAAHSGYPELGRSAIDLLIQQLGILQEINWGEHPIFGQATLNIGRIEGGVAGNVIAPEAHALGHIRVVTSTTVVEDLLREHLLPDVECEVLFKSEPLELFVPDGFTGEVVKFGSDATYFSRIAPVLMVGPGSIHWAHTDREHIHLEDMKHAVQLYQNLIKKLLS